MTSELPSYRWRFAHLAALWGYGRSARLLHALQQPRVPRHQRRLTRGGDGLRDRRRRSVRRSRSSGSSSPAAPLDALASVIHVLAVWVAGFAAALQLLELFNPTSAATLVVPVVLAYAGAVAYVRWRAFRSFLSISIVLPLLSLVLFLATAPLALGSTRAASVDIEARTPIVLIVFDEFGVDALMRSEGALDEKRYPAFGRLARDATWYRRATTVHAYTTQAVPAIVTGNVPRRGALPTLADHPRNLFTLLGETDAFRVREPVTVFAQRGTAPTPLGDRLVPHVSGLSSTSGSTISAARCRPTFGETSARFARAGSSGRELGQGARRSS